MASVHDCAVLADDVYNRVHNRSARGAGWERIDAQNWGYGFAAGRYRSGDETVLAFRGTDADDRNDVLSDALMVPLARPGAAQRALERLFEKYGVSDAPSPLAGTPMLLELVLQLGPTSSLIRQYANRVPAGQAGRAVAYFDMSDPPPRFVTGHSLGGALAKVVSEARGVPVIAFNSPFMGDLRGAVPATSQIILNVNTVGDPLSMATKGVGNLSHGRTIAVTIPQFRPPPRFHREELEWYEYLYLGAAVASREVRAHVEYNRKLIRYLGAVMGHYHSMSNLREAIGRRARFRLPLRSDLSNA